mmetsp:Transcript_29219/g.89498  ORF Transcript_29219/g.89498 Transcript_29219/m.89498 type:complete len:208 (-) Transcript_29219:652-1275(-)
MSNQSCSAPGINRTPLQATEYRMYSCALTSPRAGSSLAYSSSAALSSASHSASSSASSAATPTTVAAPPSAVPPAGPLPCASPTSQFACPSAEAGTLSVPVLSPGIAAGATSLDSASSSSEIASNSASTCTDAEGAPTGDLGDTVGDGLDGDSGAATSVASDPDEWLTTTAEDSASDRPAASPPKPLKFRGRTAGTAPVAMTCRCAK